MNRRLVRNGLLIIALSAAAMLLPAPRAEAETLCENGSQACIDCVHALADAYAACAISCYYSGGTNCGVACLYIFAGCEGL
jgi:hypothetical protein